MELVSAICPHCNKEVKVNTTEEVLFCDYCNKPFKVKDAIKLYVESIERSKAAKKPSDEAVAKFNAILEQDTELAYTYMEDIIKKEYPKECLPYLICGFNSWLVQKELYQYLDNNRLHEIRRRLDDIHLVNPCIAAMYYQVLCAHVNFLYKQKYNKNYSGQLAILKMCLHSFEWNIKCVKDSKQYNLSYDWNRIEDAFAKYKSFRFQDYDDAYVDDLINAIESLKSTKLNWQIGHTGFSRVFELIDFDEALRRVGKSANDLIERLENLYSPEKKKKVEQRKRLEKQKREEAERLEKERKYQQAFEKEVAFWQQYIDLLKSGKIKKALAFLEETYKSKHTDELAKFKKGVLGVKYLGDVSSLQAEMFAKLTMFKRQ